jgi:hypothetical protein
VQDPPQQEEKTMGMHTPLATRVIFADAEIKRRV